MNTVISEISLISDLVEKYPQIVSFLAGKGLHCIVCGEPVWGTVGELAQDKGFSKEETAQLIQKLIDFIQA